MSGRRWICPETDPPEISCLYTGVFFLGIDGNGNGTLQGRLGHLFFGRLYPFESLDEAFLLMERLMDSLKSPAAGRQKPAFPGAKEPPGPPEPSGTWESDDEGIARCSGKTASFLITVSRRDRGSWQGNVIWIRQRQTNLRERFESALQLLCLIRGAAASGEDKTAENGERAG